MNIAARVSPADKNQQFTPAPIVRFAREVMGSIELDPASSRIANQVVKADRYFTAETDCLTQSLYCNTMFFNPPYGAGLIAPMIEHFVEQWDCEQIGQAIVLVNSSTSAVWYQSLLQRCNRLLLPRKRLQFWNAESMPKDLEQRYQYFERPKGKNRYDSTIFYFGPNTEKFEFSGRSIGVTLRPSIR